MSLQVTRRVPSSLVVFHLSGGGALRQLVFWISAMERISTCSIPTLLKRISLIERVIDIDDCLTMFALSLIVQCISLSFPASHLFRVW